MSISLSESAAAEVKKILKDQSFPEGTMLRVGVAGGGCSGFSYKLNFDQSSDENADEIMDFHGVKVVIDKKSELYLSGTTIDFYEGIDKRGFVFNNPHAVKTCGCGSSFST